MAVTAYAASGDEERFRAAGAQAYVSKPISVVRFVESVSELLESAGVPVGSAGEHEQGDAASAQEPPT
jgi:two-component system cell cycle response regulator DivK